MDELPSAPEWSFLSSSLIKEVARFGGDVAGAGLSGADAALQVAPYYNKPNQEGYYQHYKAVAGATKKDIILYNVPGRTGGNVAWETQIRIAKDFKNVVATKEASGNMEQIMKVIKNKPKGFMVISGDDNLTLPLMAIGGRGVISVIANLVPRETVEMTSARPITGRPSGWEPKTASEAMSWTRSCGVSSTIAR